MCEKVVWIEYNSGYVGSHWTGIRWKASFAYEESKESDVGRVKWAKVG